MQGDVTQQAAFLALQGDIVQQILLFGLTLYSALARTAVNYDGAAQGVFPELLGYISLYITQVCELPCLAVSQCLPGL